jgi:hypothetical protein
MSRFEKGHSGRPSGTRNKLAQRVFSDIFAHWCEPAGNGLVKGQAALELLWREEPAAYLRLTASVLPKEFLFQNAVTDLSEEELDRMLEMLREHLEARREQAIELKPMALINGH